MLLTIICLLLTANTLKRTHSQEQLPQGFDLLGALLGASAFTTVIGGGVSAWLVCDTATEYKRVKHKLSSKIPNEELAISSMQGSVDE